jgi:hypothetical protein
MKSHSLTHVPDDVLRRDLAEAEARGRATHAKLLAYLVEVGARRLYLQAGYPSMFAYCVNKLHLDEDVAAEVDQLLAERAQTAEDLPAPGPVRDCPAPQGHEARPDPPKTPLSPGPGDRRGESP